MIYLTGDCHGDFTKINDFYRKFSLTKDDIIIILGDAGLNFFMSDGEAKLKARMSNDWPFTLFMIHGNHERRPETIPSYTTKKYRGGTVFFEEKYPNLLFAKDGEIYDFDGYKTIVIGGAYSLDKRRRIEGESWWPDEQPSPQTRKHVEDVLQKHDWKIDVVLSHTGPRKYEPAEVFVPWVNQAKVDKSTEDWLNTIEDRLDYKKWYFGHYHIEKHVDRIDILYNAFEELKV